MNKKVKLISSNVIFVILIFSIFTSFNNIAFEKNSFGQVSSSSLSSSSYLLAKNNSKIQQQYQQQQQKQQSNNLSSFLQNVSFKNITLLPDLTVKINHGYPPKTDNFNITKGYKIEPILWNLTLPSSITFDNKENMYIAEAGYAPGELEATPRILKINSNGEVSSFVDRDLYGPITNIVFHDGKIYVSNRVKISTIDVETGVVKDIITGLPSLGDYGNNQIAFGPDGRMYFGQGTATNSGIIGKDNYQWLKLIPILHGIPQYRDIPAKNITLTGQNYLSSNILHLDNPISNISTGTFVPFGNNTKENQIIEGGLKCNGCILSANADGTDLKVLGWGFRNPSGLAFENNKNTSILWVTNGGAEERGSRPIANDTDKLYSLDISNKDNITKFYGWPDFFGNAEPVTNHKFQSTKSNQSLQFLMKDHPNVQKPFSLINDSAGVSQITFSNNSKFGFNGMAFISEVGKIDNKTENNNINDTLNITNNTTFDNKLTNTNTLSSVTSNNSIAKNTNNNTNNLVNKTDLNFNKIKGQKIAIFDPKSKKYFDFLSLKKADPSFRPLDAKFSPDGNSLYVTSFGKAELRDTTPNKGFQLPESTPWIYKNTGILWKITKINSVNSINSFNEPNKIHLSKELNVTINSGTPPNSLQNYLKITNGYRLEPILWNLDLPGSFAFDNKGNLYFASTGITYGKVTTTPAIYKISKNGTVSLLADRPLHGILSDIEFDNDNGLLYVAHRDIISTVNVTSGVVKDIVVGLPMPAYVTHPLGQLAISPTDGRIYFSIGGLSNTAVPDISDWEIGWLRDMPFMHEVPGTNITLTGQNFTSDNFITIEPKDKAITGGMMPFGTPSFKGQKIKGETRCTSCILSIKSDGSDLRLHAWGIRNAYGMVFDDKGRLFLISNGSDDKGIRRITNDPDTVYVLDPNKKNLTFYGWPDFFGRLGESVTNSQFNESPLQNYTNKPLIENSPLVTHPLLDLGMSVGNTQAAYSTNNTFGYKGKIFVGEFGTIAPVTHVFHSPLTGEVGQVMGKILGQKIAIIDTQNETVSDFITLSNPVSSFRPVGLGFSPDGNTLYLASIEKEVIRKVNPMGGVLPSASDYPFLQTGTIWKIIKAPQNVTKSNESENKSISSSSPFSSILSPYSGNNATDIFKDK